MAFNHGSEHHDEHHTPRIGSHHRRVNFDEGRNRTFYTYGSYVYDRRTPRPAHVRLPYGP